MVNELNRVVVFHEVMKDGITYNGGSPRIFYCYICNYGDIFTNDKGQPMKFYKEHLSHPSDIIKTYKIHSQISQSTIHINQSSQQLTIHQLESCSDYC